MRAVACQPAARRDVVSLGLGDAQPVPRARILPARATADSNFTGVRFAIEARDLARDQRQGSSNPGGLREAERCAAPVPLLTTWQRVPDAPETGRLGNRNAPAARRERLGLARCQRAVRREQPAPRMRLRISKRAWRASCMRLSRRLTRGVGHSPAMSRYCAGSAMRITHWTRSALGFCRTRFSGARPGLATACSDARTVTAPDGFANSTSPDSTVRTVTPESSTSMTQSVP